MSPDLRKDILSTVLGGLISGGIELFKSLSGEQMTEEDFRAAMRELLDEPPRKADFGPLWDAKMKALREAAGGE